MRHDIMIDHRTTYPTPTHDQLIQWITTALNSYDEGFELALSLVDEPEMTQLNEHYRHKKGPTNVLAFGHDFPLEYEDPNQLIPLGDIIICAPIVIQEAKTQDKSIEHHFAHLTLHGTLHLLGFDHETTDEAKLMEKREIELLHSLGIENPYETLDDDLNSF